MESPLPALLTGETVSAVEALTEYRRANRQTEYD